MEVRKLLRFLRIGIVENGKLLKRCKKLLDMKLMENGARNCYKKLLEGCRATCAESPNLI